VIIPYDPLIDSDLDSSEIPSVLAITVRKLPQGVALTATMRSVDAFLGLPANLYQLRCLQEHIAERLGTRCAELVLHCANVHWLPEYAAAAKKFGVSGAHTN
jgi:thymidylate synthase